MTRLMGDVSVSNYHVPEDSDAFKFALRSFIEVNEIDLGEQLEKYGDIGRAILMTDALNSDDEEMSYEMFVEWCQLLSIKWTLHLEADDNFVIDENLDIIQDKIEELGEDLDK